MVAAELPAILGFSLVVLFACSPLLGIERIRALLRWPTRWLAVNYVVVVAGLLVAQLLSYLGVILAVAGTGTVTGGEAAAIVGGIGAANLLVPGAGAVGAVSLLPPRDVWSPDGGGLDGRIALGIAVGWYAVVTTGAFVVIGLALMFANLPM